MENQTEKKVKEIENLPEIIDTFLVRTAIGVFTIMLVYASSAISLLLSPEIDNILEIVEKILGLSVFITVLPYMIKIVRLRTKYKRECEAYDGYISDITKSAGYMAFSLSFVFMLVVEQVSGGYLKDLPTEFFIRLSIAFMLAVFSITFSLKMRGSDDDNEDEFTEEDSFEKGDAS